jgi:hypothetical protein
MLKLRPTLDIAHSNRYQVPAQVDKVQSHIIQSDKDNISELWDVHHFGSTAEHLSFIHSHLADNQYLLPVAERVEDSEGGANPMQRESTTANDWPESNLHPGGSNPTVYLHQILSSGE